MTTPNIEELRLLAQTLEFSDAVRCSIQKAADLLQSQAERIKELEGSVTHWKAFSEAAVNVAIDRREERDTLRDQLAAIAATEPVAWRWVWKSKPWDIEGWCYTNTPPNHPELQEIEKLFTRPMPAQDVNAELVEALSMLLSYTKAYEGLLNCTPAVQIAIAESTLSRYKGAK